MDRPPSTKGADSPLQLLDDLIEHVEENVGVIYSGPDVPELTGKEDTIEGLREIRVAVEARIEELETALKPFADAGTLFLPADAHDTTSGYVHEPDSSPIGNRQCWDRMELTIGSLRRAARALPLTEERALSDELEHLVRVEKATPIKDRLQHATASRRVAALFVGKYEILVDNVVWLGRSYSTQAFRVHGRIVRSDCGDLAPGQETMCMVWVTWNNEEDESIVKVGDTISVETFAKRMRSKPNNLLVTRLLSVKKGTDQ